MSTYSERGFVLWRNADGVWTAQSSDCEGCGKTRAAAIRDAIAMRRMLRDDSVRDSREESRIEGSQA